MDDVAALCVATFDEGLAVRALVRGRVVVLYPVPREAAADALRAGLELSVMSGDDLEALQAVAASGGPVVPLHLCVESGMHRGGIAAGRIGSVAARVEADPRFVIAGLWSHLASPEDPRASAAQVRRFEAASESLRAGGVAVPARHLAASGGIFAQDEPALDLVRPGIATYGVLDEHLPIASGAREAAAALRPAMTLKARPVAFSEVPTGETVGYGGTWRAERPSRVAILPLGYADGYLRASQPGGVALVRGRRRALAGIVSMDAIAIDVTDDAGVGYGTEFVLLGRQGSETIAAAELARRRNTNAWEVLAGMAQRLDRVYYPEAGDAFLE
jgi:alanine racemase